MQSEKLSRQETMRCLELCCGYASFSRVAAEAFGYDAVTADSDPYFSATHTVNILEWDHAAAYPSGASAEAAVAIALVAVAGMVMSHVPPFIY